MFYIKCFRVWLAVWGGLLFQQSYSKGWDDKLNRMMDENLDVECEKHTVKMGGIEIWTSNRWYCYAYPYNSKLPEFRPSIKTMVRFSEYIEKKIFK